MFTYANIMPNLIQFCLDMRQLLLKRVIKPKAYERTFTCFGRMRCSVQNSLGYEYAVRKREICGQRRQQSFSDCLRSSYTLHMMPAMKVKVACAVAQLDQSYRRVLHCICKGIIEYCQ